MGLKAGDVCRVRSKNGALVRADRELTSAKVKELPANTVVTCVSDAVAIDSGAERESGAKIKIRAKDIFRGGESRRRRGCRVALPRPRRGLDRS